KLVAIWAAILTIPKKKQVEIHTDSNAAIKNISRGLEQTKNLQIELVKVKSYSRNKWIDKADSIAKKGVASRKIIKAKE
ncbi:26605_t:CDS:2, partial [Racocetra persica]